MTIGVLLLVRENRVELDVIQAVFWAVVDAGRNGDISAKGEIGR
jgi:hypothetical protein